jgi:hypothetical protein
MRETLNYGTALKDWVAEVLRVANGRETDPDIRDRLRLALRQVVDGRHVPEDTVPLALPGMQVAIRHGRVFIEADRPPVPITEQAARRGLKSMLIADEPLPITVAGQHAGRYGLLLLAVARACAALPVGRRLRHCDLDSCGLFFLARGDHRRKRSFCCEDDRRKFDREHRDRKQQAAYMRDYREKRRKRAIDKKRATLGKKMAALADLQKRRKMR